MARLPLVLSVTSPARSAGSGEGERGKGPFTCHFCTLDAGRAPESLMAAEAGEAPVSAIACPLCALSHRLGDDTIDQDAVVIWLPETTQGVLNLLVRHIHMLCVAHGDSPRFSNVSRPAASGRVRAARQSYLALYERSAAAASRLGTSSPVLVGQALRQLAPADYERRNELLAGARLLSAGQLHRGGDDIYPGLLQTWSGAHALNEETSRQ